MEEFRLEQNLDEPTHSMAISLNGVPPTATETPIVSVRHAWRWADEPDMPFEVLGESTPGNSLSVPFDLQGRDIELKVIGYDQKGMPTDRDWKEAVGTTFSQSQVPTLADAVFSTPDVDLTIAGNGGTQTIRILRQLGSDDYVEIATVAFDATAYVDSPSIDGTYNYKLTQDGIVGDSNIKTVVVTGISAGAGSPPTGLSAVWDTVDTVGLSWTNHGGTGDIHVERRVNAGPYDIIAVLASSATTYDDTDAAPGIYNQTFYYRVRNMSVSGYTSTETVYIPAEGL